VTVLVLFAGSVAAAQPPAEPPAQAAAQHSPPPAAPPSAPKDTTGAASGQEITPGEPGGIGSPDRWSGEAAGYPIENTTGRASGFWTSRRPAKGGAYRYRLLGIGVVLLIATLLLMIRVVRRYERPESP
jgi:hypothetical protein